MVRTAAFSRGCERCRKHHLGCDQTVPECTRCTSQGLACSGYRDQGGFLFKNESEKVIRNGKQRHTRREPASAEADAENLTASGVDHDLPVRLASHPYNSGVVQLPSADSTNFSQVPDYSYFYFTLATHVMFNRHTNATGTCLDRLILSHQNVGTSCPLLPVISQVAGQLLLLYHDQPSDSPQQLRSSIEAFRATRAALCDPVKRQKNATLLALILLDLGQCIEDARSPASPSSAKHHDAITAIVSERTPESFQDELSQSLLDAARYSVVRKAVWVNDADLNLDVFAKAENGRPITCCMTLDGIISRVLALRKQVSVCLRTKLKPSIQVLANLCSTRQILDAQLQEWIESVPSNWHPSLQLNSNQESPFQHRPLLEVHLSYGTAFIYNQWRCVRLLILGISQSLQSLRRTVDARPENNKGEADVSEQAQILCDAILSSAPFLFGEPRRKGEIQGTSEKAIMQNHCRNGFREGDIEFVSNLTKMGGHGFWNLFELLHWMLRIVTDAEHGIAVPQNIIHEAKEILANLWF